MTTTGLVFLLAILWASVTGTMTVPNLLLGGAIGAATLALIDTSRSGSLYWLRAWRILVLILVFVRELVLASLQVAWLVVAPGLDRRLAPAIVAFPLTVRSDAEITLLANLITLTPGTLSVDVSDDRRALYVHAIAMADRDAFVRDIANGFERHIMRVFR